MINMLKDIFRFFARAYSKLDDAFSSIAGLPSYDEYVQHFKKEHPDQPPLSKKEFYLSIQKDSGKRPRCW